MNTVKKLAALLLVLALGTGTALAAPMFPATQTMPVFSDLSPRGTPGSVWYDYNSVKICVETALMRGTGAAFHPGGVITIAEVATIAARIHEKTGNAPLPPQEAGQPWYASAMERMAALGIAAGDGAETSASRSSFVRMLAAVLPQSMTVPINTITSLPDSRDTDVLRFYNAGFLTGKDIYGTFDGAGTLTRAEVAAMVARIADTSLRKAFSPAYTPQNGGGHSLQALPQPENSNDLLEPVPEAAPPSTEIVPAPLT